MSKKLYSRKPVLLLSFLILFGVFVINKTQRVTHIQADTQEYVLREKVEANEEDWQLEQALFFEIDENFKPIREVKPGMVLGEQDVCVTPFYSYSSEKVCARTFSFDADMGKEDRELSIGDMVDRKASISLTSIEVPPLLNGSPTMDSSVRQIFTEEDGTEHWTLRPAGEMINKEVVAGNMYPGETQTQAIIDAGEASKTKSFGINYSIEGTANAKGSGTSEISISKYQVNDCGAACRNYSNPTPEKYLSGSYVLGQSQNYPGYYENIPEQEDDGIDDCDTNTTFINMDLDTEMIGCTPSLKQIVISFFKEIMNIFDADRCSSISGADENCINTASIVVIMESPWGSKADCIDGKCVTEFNKLRNGSFSIPNADESQKIYVLTTCYANIGGYGNKALSCAWDIDYITQELEFQSHDNMPQEVFPDRMDYMNFHVWESENRTDPVYKM
ncbi:hypothetical protein K8R20_02920 [bacterium]|nr:hypothetical protein [bacterium]